MKISPRLHSITAALNSCTTFTWLTEAINTIQWQVAIMDSFNHVFDQNTDSEELIYKSMYQNSNAFHASTPLDT